MRTLATFTLIGLLVLSAATVGVTTAAPTTTASPSTTADVSDVGPPADDVCTPVANGSEAPNPDEDRLGWENGCWHNASLDVDRTDGLNQTEMDAIVARAMARIELIRQLEFERDVPVKVISRTEYANDTTGRFEDISETERVRQNVKWEALFMVNGSTDAVDVQKTNTAEGVGGYYSPSEEQIVIVSDNETSPKIDEITLSQELFHALQDRRFNLAERFNLTNFDFGRRTEEKQNAINGIIEGDATLLDLKYERRCDAEWDCVTPNESDDDGIPSIHWGMYLINYQPYSDGPKFVDSIYEEEGWEGVNAVYDDPPASTEQVIHPEKYPDEEPTEVSFTDRSNEEWHIPEAQNDSIGYASVGEPGIASMLFYPYYDTGRERTPIIPLRGFINVTDSGPSSYDLVQYGNNPYASGWDGDRLYPYVADDSAETGYVWKTVWDNETHAEQFVDGYSQLLDYHNATPVDGRANTYRISADQEFAGAFYVEQQGNEVVVVNAPSVEELSAIRTGAAPETEPESTETTVDPTTTAGPSNRALDDATTTPSSDVPGFGILPTFVALAGAALLVRRR